MEKKKPDVSDLHENKKKIYIKQLDDALAGILPMKDKYNEAIMMDYRMKRSFEGFKEKCQKMKAENRSIIKLFKDDNLIRTKRRNMFKTGDLYVTEFALRKENEREYLLKWRKYASRDVIPQAYERTRVNINKLNKMKDKREKLVQKMNLLEEEWERLEEWADTTYPQQQKEATATNGKLENDIDKVWMKYHMARNITHHYRQIIRKMGDDASTYMSRLEVLEDRLWKQRREVYDLSYWCHEARDMYVFTKEQLDNLEETLQYLRRKRENQLSKLKMDLDKKVYEELQLLKEMFKNVIPVKQSNAHKNKEYQDRQKKILSSQETVKFIQDATHVDSIDDVIHQWKLQNVLNTRLTEKIGFLEMQREHLKKDVIKMREDFEEIKFSGHKKVAAGEQVVDQATHHNDATAQKQAKLAKEMRANGEVVVAIKGGISKLYDLLLIIRGPFDHLNTDDVLGQLEVCMKKVERLKRQSDMVKKDVDMSRFEDYKNEFDTYMELLTPEEQDRVTNKADGSGLLKISLDFQDQQAVTRVDLKKMYAKKLSLFDRQGRRTN